MILILCHLHDSEAAWVAQRLHHLAPGTPVLLVSAEELLYARQIQHTLGREPTGFVLTLQNGQRIAAGEVTAVVNRLCFLDPTLWQQKDTKQYHYVLQEVNALYLSMLHSLPPECLYNRPSAVALGGRHLSPAEWQLLGARVGLPVDTASWPPETAMPAAPPDARLLVLDEEILGQMPPGIVPESCFQLAHHSGLRLLELHFERQVAGYRFVGATIFAALHQYGDALAHHFLRLATDGHDLGNTQRDARAALAR